MPRGVPQARFSGKTPIVPARRHVRLRILPEPAKVINYKHGTCRRDCRTAAFSVTPSADFAMPDDIWLRALLRNAKDIAILGAKDKPGQPVDGVGRYLLRQGYKIWPVHPARATVWGLAAYQDLASLPKPVDIIDVFRAPQHCPEHARQVLALPWRPKVFWMQSGIVSPEARELLEAAGVAVVENACLMVEHARLLGSAAEQQA